MPKEVDRDARLAEIAEATIQIVRTLGSKAVTIRSVARQLGGSTALVTNYLPSRSALILNVLDRVNARWIEEYERKSPKLEPLERFFELLSWRSHPDDSEVVFRALIFEIITNAESEPALLDKLQRESRIYREVLVAAASDAGFIFPLRAADIGYLLLRGQYFANAENPDYWRPELMREITVSMLSGLSRKPRDDS